ncbi:MAG: hypothetical protein LBQ14_07350 [Treponema sp.]|nr:hypothetical protein [Treponema sp.]
MKKLSGQGWRWFKAVRLRAGLAALIAFALLAAGVLSACSGGGGGGDGLIPAKFLFSGSAGPSSPSGSSMMARSLSIGGPSRSWGDTGEEGFELYTNAYGELGDKVGSAITPTELKLAIIGLTLAGDGGALRADLIEPPTEENVLNASYKPEVVDLANPVTLTLGNVQSGFYDAIVFNYIDGHLRVKISEEETKYYASKVTFPWPAGMNKDDWAANASWEDSDGNADIWGFTGDQIYAYPRFLEVYEYVDAPLIGGLQGIFFYGDTYKMFNTNGTDDSNGTGTMKEEYFAGDFFDGYPVSRDWVVLHCYRAKNTSASALFVPFEGIDIPADAKAVRFEIRWKVDGLIERYDAKTPVDVNDDYFVFKNGWWNNFSIQAFVEM